MPHRITPGTLGAISEHLAVAFWMSNGYHTFRNCSPNGPVDLLVMRDAEILRVEVKGITVSSDVPRFTWPVNSDWDELTIANPATGWVKSYPSSMSRDEITRDMRVENGFFAEHERMSCGAIVLHKEKHLLRCMKCSP